MVVSIFILDVSLIILEVSLIILEVSVVIVEVESFVVSVVEEPPLQAAKNAEIERTISTFFILIDLEFDNLFVVYTRIEKK